MNPFPDDWDEPEEGEVEKYCGFHRVFYTTDNCPGCLKDDEAERKSDARRDDEAEERARK